MNVPYSIALTWLAVSAEGTAVPPETLPRMVWSAWVASFANVTALAAMSPVVMFSAAIFDVVTAPA